MIRKPRKWTAAALADAHARCCEAGEDPVRRRREAERTIASAYRRPTARPQRRIAKLPDPDQIDNGLREALLKRRDGPAFLRVYEGLRLSGLRPGDTVTHAEARQRLDGLVGDHSIRRALAMTIGGQAEAGQDKAKRCFVPQQEPTKNRRGRPRTHYRIPAADDLRRALGLASASAADAVCDPITADDLRSVRTYRAALEREFIRRCPGQYPQQWLAERLGVSVRSIYTYHRDADISATPCFVTTSITWANYTTIPPNAVVAKRAGLRPGGRFLEDEEGKRYPPKPGIAMRLLGQGRQVWLKERTYSQYQVNDGTGFLEQACPPILR